MKLVRSVLEYIFMVGIPIVGIVLILHAGGSHKAPPPVGNTWQLHVPDSPERPQEQQTALDNIARCYGLKVPLILHIQQSGRHLHTYIGKEAVQGKITDNTWHFAFKPHSGACTDADTHLHGDLLEKNPTWPAILDSQSCKKCTPIHVVIHRKKG